MRLLITGGLGYLGGRVAQYLTYQADHEILLGSRSQTDTPHWLPQAKIVQTLWGSQSGLDEICAGVDAIVHLTGMNAKDCTADPLAALEANAVATANLLQAAIRQKVKRFIYVSTAHVYADPLVGVITEETCPVNLHPYATSHRAGEDVVRAAHKKGEITGIVIRLSNAYGAPAHDDANCWMLLVNDLCKQAVQNKILTLHSNGTQQRDFITLLDVSRVVSHFLKLPKTQCADGLFNVGGECVMTVWDMARQVAKCCQESLGYEPEIERKLSSSEEQSYDLQYEIKKLKQSGFDLSGQMNEEITKTLEWCAWQHQKNIA